ncbi:MAG: TRAP transporter small permease [Planctomycetes bacterium]|nr:TRAP transporter small permease [Planctomycetota bacterium]
MTTSTEEAKPKHGWLEENFEELILVVLLIIMAGIMGIQVFSRYALKSSLVWSEELTRYMFIWSGFLSIAYCARKKLGLRVDLLIHYLPTKVGFAMTIIALILEAILFIYLMPFAYRIMMLAVDTGRLSPATQIPMWMMQSAPFIGFGLAALRIIQRVYRELTGQTIEVPKTVEDEAVTHFVEEAEEDLKAGHSTDESLRKSWTYRFTKKPSSRREDKK